MGVLSWIILGLVVGILAKFVMPGRDGGGLIMTSILGIVGAFVGGFIGSAMGWGTVSGFDMRSVALAVLGAVVVLFFARSLGRR